MKHLRTSPFDHLAAKFLNERLSTIVFALLSENREKNYQEKTHTLVYPPSRLRRRIFGWLEDVRRKKNLGSTFTRLTSTVDAFVHILFFLFVVSNFSFALSLLFSSVDASSTRKKREFSEIIFLYKHRMRKGREISRWNANDESVKETE